MSGRSDRLCLARARSEATGAERVVARIGRALGPDAYSAIGMWRAASAGPQGPKRSVARRSPGPKGIARLMAVWLIAARMVETREIVRLDHFEFEPTESAAFCVNT